MNPLAKKGTTGTAPIPTGTLGSTTPEPLRAGRLRKTPLGRGHSPLDWASANVVGGPLQAKAAATVKRSYTLEDLKAHSSRDDLWMALNGKVYDVTAYLPFHPGGARQLLRGAGKDATALFLQVHPWVNAPVLLKNCVVGTLDLSNGGSQGGNSSNDSNKLGPASALTSATLGGSSGGSSSFLSPADAALRDPALTLSQPAGSSGEKSPPKESTSVTVPSFLSPASAALSRK